MLSEKGLCKILKQAYRTGYEVMPGSEELRISTRIWAIRCLTTDLPVKAAIQIVENAGYMPATPLLIQEGAPNQSVMAETAMTYADFFRGDANGEWIKMRKIPVIYRERWQLYQTENGAVYGFDLELLRLIDFKTAAPDTMIIDDRIGCWCCGDTAVYIAAGRFSDADEERIWHLSKLDWEHQQQHEDPVANTSMFDPYKDEPLAERSE